MLRDEFDAVFIGALGDPRVPDNRHARDILLGTRFELDLYVNYRPVKLLDERLCPLKGRGVSDVNLVVFRENTEGPTSTWGRFKAGTDDEVAIQEEINTFKGVHRIVKHAFAFARAKGRRSVCMADKSNAMTHGHACGSACSVSWLRNIRRFRSTTLYIYALTLLMVQILRSSTSSSRTTCLATSSRIWRRAQGGWAWPRLAICTQVAHRCSSRCTDRRRHSPGRTCESLSARFCPRH